MSIWVEFAETEKTIVNLVLAEADVATKLGLYGPVTTLDPVPGPGWTTTATRKNWTPPPPLPPTPRVTATNAVKGLFSIIDTKIASATSDAKIIAGIKAGTPLTATEVAALQRHAVGWVTLLKGLKALTVATGIVG